MGVREWRISRLQVSDFENDEAKGPRIFEVRRLLSVEQTLKIDVNDWVEGDGLSMVKSSSRDFSLDSATEKNHI